MFADSSGLPVAQTGQVYNLEDARSGLREVFSLGLFENVSINAHQDTKDESKINVEVMVRERPMKTAEIECEWAIAPGDSGRPSLVSIIPGELPRFSSPLSWISKTSLGLHCLRPVRVITRH